MRDVLSPLQGWYKNSRRRDLRDLRYHELMARWGKPMFCCRQKKENQLKETETSESASTSCRVLRAVGWTSVAVGVTALGLYVGRELRIRYKFRRRTPSDFYSHAGEDLNVEYGMGI